VSEELPITTSWHSYPKLFALGQSIIAKIFMDPVTVEEKIDGSQFSWGIFGGELKCRSKGAVLNILAPEKMFMAAVDTAKRLAEAGSLKEGWTYRAEYLAKPKHNTLAYERIPRQHLIGFDINTGHEHYMSHEEKAAEFDRLGLDCVPLLHFGVVESHAMFRSFLDKISILGAQKIEGVVVKNYSRFGPDGKAMMGKFVSEEFKEVHGADWKERNPEQNDIILKIVNEYKTPARWRKAIQHAKEAGKLENSPRDISLLLKEIGIDTHAECAGEIKDKIFSWAWPKIARGISMGFPEWYKEELLKSAFNDEARGE
jgi:hypothetical protein